MEQEEEHETRPFLLVETRPYCDLQGLGNCKKGTAEQGPKKAEHETPHNGVLLEGLSSKTTLFVYLPTMRCFCFVLKVL